MTPFEWIGLIACWTAAVVWLLGLFILAVTTDDKATPFIGGSFGAAAVALLVWRYLL